MCYSCKEGHYYAEGHPAGKTYPRRASIEAAKAICKLLLFLVVWVGNHNNHVYFKAHDFDYRCFDGHQCFPLIKNKILPVSHYQPINRQGY